MKYHLRTDSTLRLVFSLALTASLALPLAAQASSITLATSPLATSTTSTVMPNVMFLLDNSGSMDWLHMPDDATDPGSSVTFSYGYYGERSSQCNQVYYDPNTTYLPPVDSAGAAYTDASFANARVNGYSTAACTASTCTNLDTGYKAADLNPDTLGQSAYYYSYSGAQLSQQQKNYNSTTNTFYSECHNSTGGSVSAIAPASGVGGVFTKGRYATTETTTITVSSSTANATFTITVSGSNSTPVSSITVGGTTITSGASTGSSTDSTEASNLRSKITQNGYSATSVGAVITVTGPASVGAAVVVNLSSGTDTFTVSAITPISVVSGITVGGTQLMSGAAAISSSTSTTATNIAAKITLNSFSATASGSTVTISGPTTAANYAPVITYTGSVTFAADVFPDTSAAKLTNFANWYSFYRSRLLMMKTAAGRAFKTLDNHYRVGFTKLSSSATPTRYLDTFESTHRTNWYSSLYGTTASGSTPLREALSNAGRYYAGQLSGTDPVQYSCQQNFTIMSTDGFWNGNAGFKVDGSNAVGNQDGTAARPMYDGASGATIVTTIYSQNTYSQGGTSSSGCTGSKHKLKTQPQTFSCSVTTVNGVAGAETCTSPSNNGGATYTGLCVNSVTLPSPNPSTRVFVSSTSGTTTVGGTSDTLADVAMYYYQTDLRTSTLNNCTGALGGTIDVCENNVFKTDTDSNTAQHMATFTLGMGASGKMNYSPSYLTDSSGDYYSVWKGVTAHPAAATPVCSWQADGTTCNWPFPGLSGGGDGYIENIDDLWHAAVNGHGAYFSATSPTSLASGLSSALAAIASRKGSSAAAATSTLNPVAGNNYAYVASYTTVKWQGNLEARTINTSSGEISQAATWCVETLLADSCPAPGNIVADSSGGSTVYNCVISGSTAADCAAPNVFDVATSECRSPQLTNSCVGTMPGMVGASSDTRTIKTANSTGTALIDFDAAYATANPTNFAAAHINTLSQWTSLTATQKTAAEGVNLMNFLRGQTGFEDRAINLVGAVDNRLYRYRESTLGDALESQPIFISKPVFSYADPGYSEYVTLKAGRVGTVYMGTNDGMLHAFAAKDDTTASPVEIGGKERWAYVPSMVIPNMWKLADKDYATKHTNFVNGSPIISDVCTANCTDSATAVWKTILVGGLNAGGRGYYALDITVPATPTLLWEFTTANDSDMGYSYGNPVITAKSDGTWVVLLTSGYNNTSPGNGQGYLYVLNAGSGAIISKIDTGVGSTTTPSGLNKISAWNDVPASNRATFVYGGDLLGNVWRFDINTVGTPLLFATLLDPSGNPQPVTTAPVLGKIGGKRIIFVGTGKYLETSDLTNTQKQTLYAIKDDNATVTLSNPAGSPRNSTTLVQQTLTEGNGVRTASNNPVNFNTGRGWYVDFPDSGERSNIESRLVQGTLLIATIVPSNTVCSPGGYGWLNFFDYQSGSSIDTSAIVSAKYDNTIVGINVLYIDGKPVVETVTSNDPTPKVNDDVLIKGTATGFTGKRVLWRELNP